MLHYSCDRCQRMIDGEDDLRYVVKVEAHAAISFGDEVDEDRDHLEDIEEILNELDEEDCGVVGEDIYQKRRYDLCPDCFRKYMKNPLGTEMPMHLGFSTN